MQDVLVIDGRQGEGGGQVLRTSLALAVALGRPVRIEHVRGGRAKPGLARQHLACVRAAVEVSGGAARGAEARGAELGSQTVEFHPVPGGAQPGSYRFAVGSAGSTSLVLQTVLAPLCIAAGPSEIELEGGTHNPMAPPFDFLARSFAPVLARTGARLELELLRHGFAPAGGGRLRARIVPCAAPRAVSLMERGEARRPRVEITLAHVPERVATREWSVLQRATHWPSEACTITELPDPVGPGNAISVELGFAEVTTICTSFGERGLAAERVAKIVAREVSRYDRNDAPVCRHLADQLMLPLALLGGGTYRATELTRHAETNAAIIDLFLPGAVRLEEGGGVVVNARSGSSLHHT